MVVKVCLNVSESSRVMFGIAAWASSCRPWVLKHYGDRPRGQRFNWSVKLTWQYRGCHTSFFPFSENGEWNFFSSTGDEWRMENDSRRRFHHKPLFLTRGHFFHTTKSAWWMTKQTSNMSVWIKHKFLPHAGGKMAIHILHSPCSTEKLSYWLLFFFILHSPRSHSPFSNKVWQPIMFVEINIIIDWDAVRSHKGNMLRNQRVSM